VCPRHFVLASVNRYIMTMPDAAGLLDREFLEIRARLLQVAAAFDRIGRAPGSVDRDPRLEKLQRALAVLQSSDPNRAEQIQLIFSRPYDAGWPEDFGLGAIVRTAGQNGSGANGSPARKNPPPK